MANDFARELNKLDKYIITRANELTKLLKKRSPEILNQVGKDSVHRAKVLINQYWYGGYSPKDYQRTYSLRDSIKYKIEGNSVRVYLDLSDAERSDFGTHKWGSYTDFKNESSFDTESGSGAFLNYIDNGWFGSTSKFGSKRNPRAKKGGIDISSKMDSWLARYIEPTVRKRMRVFLGSIRIR